jgi:hypothetical protein
VTEKRKEARREACEELARLLERPDGLRLLRLARLVGWTRAAAGDELEQRSPETPRRPTPGLGHPRRERSVPAGSSDPVPIGPWQPQRSAEGVVFVRPDPPEAGDPWPAQPVLVPKRVRGPRRILLLGESTAAGWFYAPAMTPARVLEEQLREVAGEGRHEVVDLAKVDLRSGELAQLARACLQLRPDVLVVVAGNNWPTPMRPVPPPGHLGSAGAALAFRDGGVRGLARMAGETTLRIARQSVRQLAEISRQAGVPLVIVVPEVNLGSWERARPVAWLPGDATAEWHGLRDRARGLLDEASYAQAADTARAMIALDGGTCSTSQRLLATALVGLDEAEAAAAACRAEVNARAWDNFPNIPGATTEVQEALRKGAADHGLACVDLPRVFARHLGSPLPGARLFLDYCHLTAEATHVAMAAVTAEVLRLGGADGITWPSLAARLPPPRPAAEVEARVRFLTALYHAHWESPAGGRPPAIEAWLRSALDAWPGIADTMLGYVATRAVPKEALLFSSEQQRLLESRDALPPLVWNTPSLDPGVLEAIGAALEQRGFPARERIDGCLLQNHAADVRWIDLLDRAYFWGPPDERAASLDLGGALALRRSFWPSARFCLVAGGGRDVALELTARVPSPDAPAREASATLALNGRAVASVTVAGRWRRHRLRLPGARLRRGINRLTLRWPPLHPDGDAATAAVRERLDLGLEVELHPVFGELCLLRAGPSNP